MLLPAHLWSIWPQRPHTTSDWATTVNSAPFNLYPTSYINWMVWNAYLWINVNVALSNLKLNLINSNSCFLFFIYASNPLLYLIHASVDEVRTLPLLCNDGGWRNKLVVMLPTKKFEERRADSGWGPTLWAFMSMEWLIKVFEQLPAIAADSVVSWHSNHHKGRLKYL